MGEPLARTLACLCMNSLSGDRRPSARGDFSKSLMSPTELDFIPVGTEGGGRPAVRLSRKQSRLCLRLPRGPCLLWHRRRQKPGGASDDTQTESLVVPTLDPSPPPHSFPSEVVLCVIRPDGEEALWAGRREGAGGCCGRGGEGSVGAGDARVSRGLARCHYDQLPAADGDTHVESRARWPGADGVPEPTIQ